MKRKTKLWLCLLLLSGPAAYAQVKIGDNPNTINSNSMLELESTNKGFLAPRVTLTSLSSATPLTAPVTTGMLVYNNGGTVAEGFYYWSGTKWLSVVNSTNIRSNYVLVKSASDFPAPVSGVITLSTTTIYELNGTITVSDKINLNGSTIYGHDVLNDKLVYTGSQELFTGNMGGTLIKISMIAPNVGSKVFNIDATASPQQSLSSEFCYYSGCYNLGLLKGFNQGAVTFVNTAFIYNTYGLTVQDNLYYVAINSFWDSNSNTHEKLVGSFGTIQISGGVRYLLAANSAKGVDVSGVTSVTIGAEMKNVLFGGDGTYVVGSFSNKWEVESNGLNTEKDDLASGNFYVSSTATTVISTVNTPYKVAGTTTANNLFRVTSPLNNRLTYTGRKSKKFQVICSLTATFTSAVSNKFFTFYIAKNGTVLTESKQKVKLINNTDQAPLTLSCTVELSTNDYVELWVANNTDGTDIIIQSMNMAIK